MVAAAPRRDPRVGSEDAGGHGHDGVELLLLDQNPAQGPVGLARPEHYAVGHDDGGAAAGLEQAQEQGQEQQLGLLRLDDPLQVLGCGLVVETARKRRIGEDERVPLGVVPACRQVGLGQRVPVTDVRILHGVQQHVHAADAQHGVVEVVAVEGALVEPAAGLGVPVDAVAVVLDEMLGGGDEEAGGAASGIADDVLRGGCGHVHHQPDDVARRAELPVLPGGGDLAEHVLVEITLGVAVGHVDVVELVDHIGQHPSRGHHEEGVLHVMGVGRSLVRVARLAQRFDEGEHPVPHGLEHLLRRKLLETRPAQSVVVGSEHRLLDRVAGAGGLVLLARVQLVQALDEQQVGELLDDRERVRDAARPHGVPDLVDLGLQLTGDHDSISPVSIESLSRLNLEVSPSGMCRSLVVAKSDGSFGHHTIKRCCPASMVGHRTVIRQRRSGPPYGGCWHGARGARRDPPLRPGLAIHFDHVRRPLPRGRRSGRWRRPRPASRRDTPAPTGSSTR